MFTSSMIAYFLQFYHSDSADQGDIYRLFGGSQTYTVERQTAVDLPPMVNFFLNDKDAFTRSNISYALIIKTAGPYSCAPGQDPWYATEKTRAYSPIAYQVQPGRPVLSCWEDRTWHLNGKDVEGPVLDTLPSPKLHNIWAGAVCPLEFQPPSQARLGRVARSAALGSASYAVAPYVLDAGASYIPHDLERLVLERWARGQNVLYNATVYYRGDIPHVLQAPGGWPEASTTIPVFVLPSRDVVILSLCALVSVLIVLRAPSLF